jgi:hypothetical protein
MPDKSPEVRTYEIVSAEGRFRMDIPEDWKVTYGPVSPGGKYGGGSNALRVYESDTKQRAIFIDVTSFRDLSIPVQRLLIKEEGSETWAVDRNSRRRSSTTNIQRKWVPEGDIESMDAEADPEV